MVVINLVLIVLFTLQDSAIAFPDRQLDASTHPANHGDEKIKKDPSSKKSLDDTIVFPTDSPTTFDHPRIIDTLSSRISACGDSNFCENVSNYPEDLIREALKSRHDLRHMASTDPISSLSVRIGTQSVEPMCFSIEEIVFPRQAQNRLDEWVYVVNQEGFRQGIRTERCINRNATCNFTDGLPEGYVSKCKQKYYYRSVVGVLANLTVEPVLTKFPSSCCCQVEFKGINFTL